MIPAAHRRSSPRLGDTRGLTYRVRPQVSVEWNLLRCMAARS